MDRLRTLDLFVRIVDRGSFTAAAAELGISRPVATAAIRALEERLGTRLLERSTRHVRPTTDGLTYCRSARSILAGLEDADRAVGGSVSGTVRVDVPGNIARTLLLPALPPLLRAHPGLQLLFGEGERFVDLLREGVDCVVRSGTLVSSDMVARRVGAFEEIVCASPDYLRRHGTPATPDDLDGHEAVGFVSSRTGAVLPLEFQQNGVVREILLPSRVLVTTGGVGNEAACQGFGLYQAPKRGFLPMLRAGVLVEVLAGFRPPPTPVSVMHHSHRQVPARLRVVLDWLADTLQAALAEELDTTPGSVP
ncbi:LysR family transcriptional regulator [Acetobacteraceae bacterium KSS8]|uniref:LysR family transcriptional regulator n=1 Tax=Endosaccharibacter trunci TaxID=2812733 RepID=A0ABT1WAF1_9PROT|nr:LysR family transcriptional regulator [Acetobacteraceae bacterium KSS8]